MAQREELQRNPSAQSSSQPTLKVARVYGFRLRPSNLSHGTMVVRALSFHSFRNENGPTTLT